MKNKNDFISMIGNSWTTIGNYAEFTKDEPSQPLTLKEKVPNIPYFFGYWLTYPVLRLAYKIWDGIEDAYLDAFEI